MSETTQHEPATMVRNVRETYYCYRGWKSKFECPVCGKTCMQNLNFLGSRVLVCNGVKTLARRR